MLYSKPFLTLQQQVQLLQSRGMEVSHSPTAAECLRRIGYYRLSAYWYPFRQLGVVASTGRSDIFEAGSRLEDVVALYAFDKKLKLLLLDAIEQVEISIRVEISLLFGAKGANAYTDARNFDSQFLRVTRSGGQSEFAAWTDKFQVMLSRSRNEEFVRHFQRKYAPPLPIWMAVELWDFGLLSWFYAGMLVADRTRIARYFSIPGWKLLQSWLRSLNHVRNIIAHHGRLWNRTLVDYPTLPRQDVHSDFDPLLAFPNIDKKIYTVCCVLQFLLKTINPQSTWKDRFIAHIDVFPVMPHAQINAMGFPAAWKTHAFWN